MKLEIKEAMKEIVTRGTLLWEEPMSRHTTFRIGGNAECFISPTKEELPLILQVAREQNCPVTVIGNGSNLLVGDKGIKGIVISLGKEMSEITIEENRIQAEAGALLSKVATTAAKASKTGMEFAAGIPGTLGGAVVMNAGAYGGEMKDVVERVKTLTLLGEEKEYRNQELEFSYRHSKLLEGKEIVTEVELNLSSGDSEQILATMEELKGQRKEKQPLEYPSAGSTFKRPEGYFAGKLIMDAGLRGYQVGGAQVAEKHCGFVINKDHASAKDVCELMERVSQKVQEQFGVVLEPEVRKLGEFE